MTLETFDIEQAESVPAAFIHLRIPRSDMGKEFPRAIHEILAALEARGLSPAGPPFARHLRLAPALFDFEVGFPISGQRMDDAAQEERIVFGELPAARVVRTVHRGPYEGLPAAWEAFSRRIRKAGLAVGDEFRERYLVGPEAGPDASVWRTELSWVLKDASTTG